MSDIFEPNCLPGFRHCYFILVKSYQTWSSASTSSDPPPKDAVNHNVYKCVYCDAEHDQIVDSW